MIIGVNNAKPTDTLTQTIMATSSVAMPGWLGQLQSTLSNHFLKNKVQVCFISESPAQQTGGSKHTTTYVLGQKYLTYYYMYMYVPY